MGNLYIFIFLDVTDKKVIVYTLHINVKGSCLSQVSLYIIINRPAAAAAVLSKRDPLPDPVPESTDEDLPVVIRMNEDEDEDATDVEEIEFQQQHQLGRTVPDNVQQEQHRFGPKQLSRSIVTDVIPRYSARPSSDGFDNAAFEG